MKIVAIILSLISLFTYTQRFPEIRSQGTPHLIGYSIGTLLIPGIFWIIVGAQASKKRKKKENNDF